MAQGRKTGGRVKGSVNKTTATIKEAITSVYEALQAKSAKPHGHFQDWAESEPTEFYKLASKLLPLQITGDPSAPITHRIELTGPSDDSKA